MLNAGLIPLLEDGNHQNTPPPEIIQIRFGAWIMDTPPLQEKFKSALPSVPSILDEFTVKADVVWFRLKSRQLQAREATKFVFIFDQFEEVFTHPERQINQMGELLTQLNHPSMPVAIQKALRGKLAEDRNYFPQDVFKILLEPLDVKIILSITSNQFIHLHRFQRFLPTILQDGIQIKPLSRAAAHEALTGPALMRSSSTHTPRFTYTPDALQHIIDYLGEAETVQPLELQIIAGGIEQKVERTGASIITKDMLDSMEQPVEEYLNQCLEEIPPAEQQAAKYLLSQALLTSGDNALRLSLHERQIREHYNIPEDTLRLLNNRGILYSRPFDRGGYTYEITSDLLVPPIKSWRAALVSESVAYEREALKKQEAQQLTMAQQLLHLKRRTRQLFMINILLAVLLLCLALAWKLSG